jgi:hypothetical protein
MDNGASLISRQLQLQLVWSNHICCCTCVQLQQSIQFWCCTKPPLRRRRRGSLDYVWMKWDDSLSVRRSDGVELVRELIRCTCFHSPWTWRMNLRRPLLH